ncbi:MAG: TolC family protein [Ignavibacteriaceae bacterium]
MKYRISIITILLILSTYFNGFSQQSVKDSLTLQQAIKLTLTNQPLLKQAAEDINAAEAKIKEQNSFYYPRVNGDISYTRIGPIPTIQFGGTGFTLAPNNNYDAHISASQLVYDFGKRSALVDLVKSYKLSTEDKLKLIKNNLSYQTVQSFYTILFTKKSIDVKNEQISTLKKHIELANKKVQSGSATDFDVLTTEVRVASAENQKIDLENDLNKEKIYLKSLLGWPSDKELNLSGNFNIDTSLFNNESLIEEAFQKRPEMKLAKDAENSAAVSKQVASLTDRPTLNIIASYGFKNGYEPNLDVLRGNWAAGINASIPIFNGNLRDAKVEEAEANLKSSSANILEIERKIRSQVELAAADLNASKSKIKTSELQVKQARDAVSRAEVKYRDGVITNLDLIDAETSLSEAELLRLRVTYENVINTYSLMETVGTDIE